MLFTKPRTVCRFRRQLTGWESGYHWLAYRVLRLQKKYSLDNNCMKGFFKLIVQFNILPIRKWKFWWVIIQIKTLAGAGYGMQVQGWMFSVFITSRIYPTLDEKKKIFTMYQSKNRHRWLFICVSLLNRRNLTKALLVSSSKFSFCFFKMKYFLLNSVLMRSVMTDLCVEAGI